MEPIEWCFNGERLCGASLKIISGAVEWFFCFIPIYFPTQKMKKDKIMCHTVGM